MWHLLSRIDFNEESSKFIAWLSANAPIAQDRLLIEAYYFGLSENGTSLYLHGAADYDAEDVKLDWAGSRIFESDESWVNSDALATFAKIANHPLNTSPGLHQVLCLGYVGLLVRKKAPLALWANVIERKPLGIGFEVGDAYVVYADLFIH